MNRRNWLELSRKLVDQFDMDYSIASIQAALGQAALSYWGEGVLTTTTYPNPFPITMSGVSLGGSVGTGIAIDPNGQITEIDATPDEPLTFTLAAADPTNPRWDLLVISYQMIGDTPVPQPSDPINTVDLNLHDDFLLSIVEGTPSGSPVYPAKQAGQIILAGLRVPANATNGTQVVVDLGIREMALQRIFENPNVIDEVPAGIVDGLNNTFTTSENPISSSSIIIFVNGAKMRPSDFVLTANSIAFTSAPALASTIEVWYLWDNPSSLNSLTGFDEIPVDTGDHLTFNLAGRPASLQSIQAFVDGAKIPNSQFSLYQGPTTDQIILSSPLSIGQVLDVFYLVNAYTVGMGGGGGGGGGGTITGADNLGTGLGIFDTVSGTILDFFSLKNSATVTWVNNGDGTISANSTGGGGGGSLPETHGSAASPVLINPSVGLVPTSAANQTWWVAPLSGSGSVPITAMPPIAAGSAIGQVLKVKSVASPNYLEFPNVSGVDQAGDVYFGPAAQTVVWTWDGINWSEDSRRV
jgi:hypothetical protein